MTDSPRTVLIMCGSDSDVATMTAAGSALDRFGIAWELRVSSAHRATDRTLAIARAAREQGYSAIIAGAGLAAHLPGVVASCTTLPVIGVPLSGGPMQGTDALYAIVQMPRGIPVATVAIDGAWNAGLLAARIIATFDPRVAAELERYATELEQGVIAADERTQIALHERASEGRTPAPGATSEGSPNVRSGESPGAAPPGVLAGT